MGDLNTRNRSLSADEPRDSGEGFDVIILPDAHITGRDAARCLHCGGFDKDCGCAANSTAAQVNQVPIGGKAIVTGVLAHRGNNHTASEFHIANP